MKKNLLILGLILSGGINIGVLAAIGYNRLEKSCKEGHTEEERHAAVTFLIKELDLSPAQEKEIESLRKSLELKVEEIGTKLREKRVQLVDLLKESQPDLEKINNQLSEIETLQTELQKMAITNLLQEKKILSPEQQEKFFSIILKRLFHEEDHRNGDLLPKGREKQECKYE